MIVCADRGATLSLEVSTEGTLHAHLDYRGESPSTGDILSWKRTFKKAIGMLSDKGYSELFCWTRSNDTKVTKLLKIMGFKKLYVFDGNVLSLARF